MNYSQSDIEFMRKDAMKRTREMHSSANNSKNVQADIPPKSFESSEENCKKDPISSIFSGLFSNGKIDNDKLIIIALIIILAKEGADLKLLIALGYILM